MFILLFVINFLTISHVQGEPLAQVSQGTLNGTIKETRNGRNYSAFLAIPYAQPPIGSLRFSNPVAGEAWDGVRAADTDANRCPQTINGKMTGDEDCLYLNVYSPWLEFDSSSSNGTTNSTLLPVMVWIHGGAFVAGTGNSVRVGAGYLLDKDIVLVTMNYRLGIFGFLSTGDSAAPGNFGLKDQVLALKWVRENIKALGGDPNRVTLFGESAGGASVSFHAISNATNGLFHQYIIQSGTPLSPWAYQEKKVIVSYVKALAALVLCPFTNTVSLVTCLRTKSAEALMGTSSIFSTIARFAQSTWTPTDEPEADDAYLTDRPENLINQMKDLPFMTGVDTDEGLLITDFLYSSTTLYDFVRLNHVAVVAFIADKYLYSDNELAFTTAVNKFYFNSSLHSLSRSTEYIEDFTRFITDGFFFYPEVRMLEKVAPNSTNPIYSYTFGYRGTFSGTSIDIGDNRNVGVTHGDELIYLFPTPTDQFGVGNLTYTATDESVIDLMVDLWTSFSMNGKPTSETLDDPDLWVPYTADNRTYLRIGNIDNNTDPTVTLSNIFYPERMNFWRENSGG